MPISAASDPRSSSPGKAPIGRGWGLKRPSAPRLRVVYRRHPNAGVGLLLGPEARVIDLEVDDPDRAAPDLGRLFPHGIPNTLGWRSARGEHRLFLWDNRLTPLVTAAVVPLTEGALELRLGGEEKQTVSVCPPSPGADGRARRWNSVWEIAPLPQPLLKELRRLKRQRDRVRRSCPRGDRPVCLGRYGKAALHREAALVRSAEPGSRNRTLNRAAYNLGQLIPAGVLPRDAVEEVLTDAALACGLPPREVRSTLRSGLEAGLRQPRAVAGVSL